MVYRILGRVILPLSRQIAKGICAAIGMTQDRVGFANFTKERPFVRITYAGQQRRVGTDTLSASIASAMNLVEPPPSLIERMKTECILFGGRPGGDYALGRGAS
jgi:hypothetical protein